MRQSIWLMIVHYGSTIKLMGTPPYPPTRRLWEFSMYVLRVRLKRLKRFKLLSLDGFAVAEAGRSQDRICLASVAHTKSRCEYSSRRRLWSTRSRGNLPSSQRTLWPLASLSCADQNTATSTPKCDRSYSGGRSWIYSTGITLKNCTPKRESI